MALLANVPTLSYIRWVNLLIVYQNTTYQIINNHTNKPYIYFDINSPNELIASNKKLEEKTGRFYIIYNQNGKYTIVPNNDIEINFSESPSRDAITSKVVGIENKTNENSQKITTVQVDIEGIKTTMTEVEESINSSETKISSIEQTIDGITLEIEEVIRNYDYMDTEVANMRNNFNSSLLLLQSSLGLFSSDMKSYMEDNQLTEEEKNEILAYKDVINERKSNFENQLNIIIEYYEGLEDTEKVNNLNMSKNELNTSFESLFNTINSSISDNRFTDTEMTNIISCFGKANVEINECKNLVDDYIFLGVESSLIEELSRITLRQDEINLEVSSSITSFNNDMSSIEERVNVAEQKITDEAIISAVSSTYTTKTELSKAVNDISSVVGDISDDISSVVGDISLIEERINVAEQKITDEAIINTVSSTYTTKTELSESINNISFGGRNLVKNSTANLGSIIYWENNPYIGHDTEFGYNGMGSVFVARTNYTGTERSLLSQELVSNLIKGEYITISGWYYIDGSTPLDDDNNTIFIRQHKDAENLEPYKDLAIIKILKNSITNTWIRFECSEKLVEDYTRTTFRVGLSKNGKIYISGLKVEKGNKATAWTPAIEDETITSDIESLRTELIEKIEDEAFLQSNKVLSDIDILYMKKSEFEIFNEVVSSKFEQTSNTIDMQFNKSIEAINEANNNLEVYKAELSTYIRFSENGIEMGKSNSPFHSILTNQKLAFTQDNTEVAYLSDNKMFITEAEILTNMRLGSFIWEIGSNGNLTLKWSVK